MVLHLPYLQHNPRAQSRQAARVLAVTVLVAFCWIITKIMSELTKEGIQKLVELILGN